MLQIEGISFLHFLEHAKIISYAQLQAQLQLPPSTTGNQATSSPTFALIISPRRYLLGISDLSGELMRYATNAVGSGDIKRSSEIVRSTLFQIREIKSQLEEFVPFIGKELIKKQSVTDESLKKIENGALSFPRSCVSLK